MAGPCFRMPGAKPAVRGSQAQRAQYPLGEVICRKLQTPFRLLRDPYVIKGMFLNSGVLGSLKKNPTWTLKHAAGTCQFVYALLTTCLALLCELPWDDPRSTRRRPPFRCPSMAEEVLGAETGTAQVDTGCGIYRCMCVHIYIYIYV